MPFSNNPVSRDQSERKSNFTLLSERKYDDHVEAIAYRPVLPSFVRFSLQSVHAVHHDTHVEKRTLLAKSLVHFFFVFLFSVFFYHSITNSRLISDRLTIIRTVEITFSLTNVPKMLIVKQLIVVQILVFGTFGRQCMALDSHLLEQAA